MSEDLKIINKECCEVEPGWLYLVIDKMNERITPDGKLATSDIKIGDLFFCTVDSEDGVVLRKLWDHDCAVYPDTSVVYHTRRREEIDLCPVLIDSIWMDGRGKTFKYTGPGSVEMNKKDLELVIDE